MHDPNLLGVRSRRGSLHRAILRSFGLRTVGAAIIVTEELEREGREHTSAWTTATPSRRRRPGAYARPLSVHR